MAQFEYGKALNRLMTPEVVSALGSVREHRGRQELYKSLQPATLEKLGEVAKIQSTGASNRIENISTSEVRLRELMQRKVEPANRDEREIAASVACLPSGFAQLTTDDVAAILRESM